MHTIRGKRRLLARLQRIRGQLDALARAIDRDAECAAVLQQIAAVRGATNGLLADVLEGHLVEHVGGGVGGRTLKRYRDAVGAVVRRYFR